MHNDYAATATNAERRLLELQGEGADSIFNAFGSSTRAKEFASLWSELSRDALIRVRGELDSNLLFRADGSHVDLRSVVFEELKLEDREHVLTSIRLAQLRVENPSRFVVLWDVDDTLLPGHDVLGIGGVDRSWHTDGRLYPGACRLHAELCGARSFDYPVLLTARPPSMLSRLPQKLEPLFGGKDRRMSILPGCGGFEVTWCAVKVLSGSYGGLSELKLKRLSEYVELFPECAGHFVFIGDDGQGDFMAGEHMLGYTCPQDESIYLVAFVAIKAVRMADGEFVVPLTEREERVRNLRERYPPRNEDAKDETTHLRFFYFETYDGLAIQLADAGWIGTTQALHVKRAAQLERAPSLLQHVWNLDMKLLRDGIEWWRDMLPELNDEQKLMLDRAEAAYSQLNLCHLRITPCSVSSLSKRTLLVASLEASCKHSASGSESSLFSPYFVVQMLHLNAQASPSEQWEVFTSPITREVVFEGESPIRIPLKTLQKVPYFLVNILPIQPFIGASISPLGCLLLGLDEQAPRGLKKQIVNMFRLQENLVQETGTVTIDCSWQTEERQNSISLWAWFLDAPTQMDG